MLQFKGEVKTYSDPSYIFSTVRTLNPRIYTPVIYVVAGLLGACSG